jgi:hypothetical protein
VWLGGLQLLRPPPPTPLSITRRPGITLCMQGPKGLSVASLVQDIIKELGLESAADVKIGDVFYKGCSGGQKRRVSIGVELMKQPCEEWRCTG